MSDSESNSYEEATEGVKLPGSQYILNQLFQEILDQQETNLITNFNILMENEEIMLDNESKNEIFQEQLENLIETLTNEFQNIFSDRYSKELDEFTQCAICFGEEVPYIKLNCACNLLLHKECYFEYLNENKQLKCPICAKNVFNNYLTNN
jgi:hypothetical protein